MKGELLLVLAGKMGWLHRADKGIPELLPWKSSCELWPKREAKKNLETGSFISLPVSWSRSSIFLVMSNIQLWIHTLNIFSPTLWHSSWLALSGALEHPVTWIASPKTTACQNPNLVPKLAAIGTQVESVVISSPQYFSFISIKIALILCTTWNWLWES